MEELNNSNGPTPPTTVDSISRIASKQKSETTIAESQHANRTEHHPIANINGGLPVAAHTKCESSTAEKDENDDGSDDDDDFEEHSEDEDDEDEDDEEDEDEDDAEDEETVKDDEDEKNREDELASKKRKGVASDGVDEGNESEDDDPMAEVDPKNIMSSRTRTGKCRSISLSGGVQADDGAAIKGKNA